uniref:Cobalt ABC transporter, ATPase subunit n=1 Tax=Cyanothece sp. (strain PCC 7425 / ATCC 29141) TaxID=395961 RepID=B8HXY8_CYAP4
MHHNPITLDHVSYHYPDGTVALKEINLAIKATERVALVGANGSGKSTLLLHLNGIFLPQSGKVTVGNYPVEPSHLTAVRDFVGVVFQNPDDQLFMPTVAEDVAFGPKNQGVRGSLLQNRVTTALHSVGLDPQNYLHRNAYNLSGGEKKRVAIAGVLAMQPQVLVFDEPTAQLDPRSRRHLIHLLQTLPQTQLIATHDLDLALELCDRTVVLNRGELIADGPTVEILQDARLLEQHSLELPLSYSRPYCSLDSRPYPPIPWSETDGVALFR